MMNETELYFILIFIFNLILSKELFLLTINLINYCLSFLIIFSYWISSQYDKEMEYSQLGICFISKQHTQEITYFHF